MAKLNRSYVLEVDNRDGQLKTVIEFDKQPFTIEFDINRKSWSSTNTSVIRIYNLNPNTRNDLRRDYSDLGSILGRTVTLRAGYGKNLPVIFVGAITLAQSVREGVDYITTIEANDLGFAYGGSYFNPDSGYSAGTEFKKIALDIVASMKDQGIETGYISGFNGQTIRKDTTIEGDAVKWFKDYTNNSFYVYNKKAYVTKPEEAIRGDIETIDASSGIIGTPQLQESNLVLDILFEPQIIINQAIKLDSKTFVNFFQSNNNATYKVIGVRHKGMISPNVGSSVITTLNLFGSGSNGIITVVNQ